MIIKHVVSISGGKDSQATLELALERCPREHVIAIFCDTDNEHELVYQHLDYLERELRIHIHRLKANFDGEIAAKRRFIAADVRVGRTYRTEGVVDSNGNPVWARDGRGRLQFKEVTRRGERTPYLCKLIQKERKVGGGQRIRWTNKAKRRALAVLHPTGNAFLDLCLWKGRFPSRKAQFCTEQLKRNMAVAFQLELIDQGFAVISWQGVRRDESLNRRDARKFERLGPNLYAFRPVVERTAEEVVAYCLSKGRRLCPLYSQGCDRVGCLPCINAGKDELRNIAARWPDALSFWAEAERLVSQASKRGFSTFFNKELHQDNWADRRVHVANNVAAVIEWSRTTRGGSQYDLLSVLDPVSGCASSYGLCDSKVAG